MGGAELARTLSRCSRGRRSEEGQEGLEACLQIDLPDSKRTCGEMKLLCLGFTVSLSIPS